jgi:hypothetical protein
VNEGEVAEVGKWLSGWDVQRLAALLEARPALARSVARGADLHQLAAEAFTDIHGGGLLHALTGAQVDLLSAAITLAEQAYFATIRPAPIWTGRLPEEDTSRGGQEAASGSPEDTIATTDLLNAVARCEDVPSRAAAERVLVSLQDLLLILPAGPERLRVTELASQLLEGARQPPRAADWVSRYDLVSLQRIGRTLGIGEHELTVRAHLTRAILDIVTDTDQVRRLTAAAPPHVHAIVKKARERLHAPADCFQASTSYDPEAIYSYHRSQITLTAGDGDGAVWLAERGLLVPTEDGDLDFGQLPREVAEAVGGVRFAFWAPPTVKETLDVAVDAPADQVAAEAALHAGATLARLEALLQELAARPALLRKAGGVAVRETRRVATRLQLPEPETGFLIEVALAADLIGIGTPGPGEVGEALLPTPAYDTWVQQGAAQRLTEVIAAWFILPTATARPSRDQMPSGSSGHDHSCFPGLRTAILTVLADLPLGKGLPVGSGSGQADTAPPGTTPAGEVLATAVEWRRPFCSDTPAFDTQVEAMAAEAQAFGLIGLGALAPPGQALLEALPRCGCPQPFPPAAAAALTTALSQILPSPQDRAHMMADLTAISAGPPSPGLAALLDSAADRETHDATSATWRFSIPSLARALHDGTDPHTLRQQLQDAAHAPLPQGLTVMIQDAARQTGRVRVLEASTCICCDDPATTADLASSTHRTVRALHLLQIAPTVLISPRSPAATLAALRQAGLLAVSDHDTSTIQLTATTPWRAPSPARVADLTRYRTSTETATPFDLARRLLSGCGGSKPS